MSEKKFTPGQWRAHCERDYSSVLADEGDATIEVCYCEAQFTDDGTVAANARLIAAAPEMYEVLERLCRESECNSYNPAYGHRSCGGCVMADVERLLAKARGEEAEK